MSADTAVKRYSAINISCPWRGINPPPDGSIDQGDRQVVMFMYSGILAGGAVVVTTRRKPVLFMENISTFMNR